MTNYEKIMRDMTIDKLAELLVTSESYDNGDYGYDGEDEYWVENWQQYYVTPADTEYSYDSFEDAVKDTIEWLKKEVKSNE